MSRTLPGNARKANPLGLNHRAHSMTCPLPHGSHQCPCSRPCFLSCLRCLCLSRTCLQSHCSHKLEGHPIIPRKGKNQRLRKEVCRLQDKLKRTRSPGAMPVRKRLKINIGRKFTEETQAEKQENTIRRDSKRLATPAPRPPQAPNKVQPGSLMVHLDEDLNVQPSQPYLNKQGAPHSLPQKPLRYGSYRPPTPPKPTGFQPLPPFPAPPPLATGPVAQKTYTQPSSARDGHRANHIDSMDSTSRQQWRPHPRTRGPSGNDGWRCFGY